MANGGETDDDELRLPEDTLAALRDFHANSDSQQQKLEELKTRVEDGGEKDTLSIETFTEDWNASQFWYNDKTASTMAEALLENATSETWIAVISTPSVFVQIKKVIATWELSSRPNLRLLEYDARFSVFKEFVQYDFNEPLRLPNELKGCFTRFICDPPFLSQDCQTKMALTIRYLQSPNSNTRLIISTGAVMRELILKLYAKHNVKTTDFYPRHTGLSNDFGCFANFETSDWKFAER